MEAKTCKLCGMADEYVMRVSDAEVFQHLAMTGCIRALGEGLAALYLEVCREPTKKDAEFVKLDGEGE
tara:strand:- start:82 stop:285 length:204 start_codon:yes stop_codon:yes gene_type:complete